MSVSMDEQLLPLAGEASYLTQWGSEGCHCSRSQCEAGQCPGGQPAPPDLSRRSPRSLESRLTCCGCSPVLAAGPRSSHGRLCLETIFIWLRFRSRARARESEATTYITAAANRTGCSYHHSLCAGLLHPRLDQRVRRRWVA